MVINIRKKLLRECSLELIVRVSQIVKGLANLPRVIVLNAFICLLVFIHF